jgi:hypothetical protein
MSPPHLELQGAANLPSYQAIMSEESQQIVELFDKLIVAPIRGLESRDVPNLHGVYVLYAPNGTVLHAGKTRNGKGGLRQRIGNHRNGSSSFVRIFLSGDHSSLRSGHSFRCLVVENARLRALLEAYAIGKLCPAHIGH